MKPSKIESQIRQEKEKNKSSIKAIACPDGQK